MNSASIELLEQRRLLSLALLGPGTPVVGGADARIFDAAVAGNGSSIVAFTAAAASFDNLQAIRYSPTGEQIGSPITLVSDKPVGGLSVAMDDNGDAVVAWFQRDSLTTDSNAKASLHLERISSAGIASAPVAVAGADWVFRQPAISMDSMGSFFLGWVRQQQPTDPQDDSIYPVEVKVQAFDSTGASRAPAITVASVGNSAEGVINISVGAKPDGSGAAFAFTEGFEGAQDNIRFGQVSTTALVGTETDIDSNSNDSDPGENSPDFAVNADGSFELAYTTYGDQINDSSDAALLIQRFSADGAPQGDPIVVSPARVGGVSPADDVIDAISIDSLPDDGFIAAYAQFGSTIDGPVFVQRFDATGAPDSDGPLQVGAHGVPVIGMDADGNAVVAFGNGYVGFTWSHGIPLSFARISTTTDFASVQNGLLSITGTAGDDSISMAVSGSDVIVMRNGRSLTFTSADVTAIQVEGFGGDDTITNNTAIPSTLEGGDGDDTLVGGSAADRLDGGAGSDSLWGEGGNDRLAGDDGHDYLFGNGGNDKIYGGLQPDFIRGNDGHDHLYGNGGNDVIYGGASNDSLYGQGGNDQLFGEGGDDHLYSDYDSGNSTLHGGAGNDTFVTKNNLADQLFGDGGHDSATADNIDLLTSIEATQG